MRSYWIEKLRSCPRLSSVRRQFDTHHVLCPAPRSSINRKRLPFWKHLKCARARNLGLHRDLRQRTPLRDSSSLVPKSVIDRLPISLKLLLEHADVSEPFD